MRPARTRRSVVLPDPFGPRTSVRPGPTSRLTARRMMRSSRTTVASWSDAPDCTVRMMGRVVPACIAIALLVTACAPEPPATEPAARGRQLYVSLGCANCHEPNLFGQRLGPPLDHIATLAPTRRPGLSAEEY